MSGAGNLNSSMTKKELKEHNINNSINNGRKTSFAFGIVVEDEAEDFDDENLLGVSGRDKVSTQSVNIYN